MFDLETAIAEWRKQMLAAGVTTPLAELEGHLREEIAQHLRSGLGEQQAFETATGEIGPAGPLKCEFKKIEMNHWNCPLAVTAWILFVVSFFLPAYADGRGWQCAGLSATSVSWPDFWHGNWITLHLASLTLANLLMIASPFLLLRFSQHTGLLKWLHRLALVAGVLVWSFLLIFRAHIDGSGLKFGAFVWGASFLLFWLSLLKSRGQKVPTTRYV